MKPPITGVVLAGGRGTRLAPLTDETSKQLLPIGGKTLVERVLDQLTAAGVVDALLVIDERHACDFMRLLEDGAKAGLRSLAYVWQSAEGRGLPSAIRQVRHLVHTEKVVIACGDVLIEDGIRGPVEDFSRQEAGARVIAMSTPDMAGYTPLRIDKDVVRDIGDKDCGDHASGYIDLGYYMYHTDVFEMIDGLHPSSRGETEIWDLNRAYVRRQQLKCSAVSGWWADVGESLETYERAHGRYAET